MSDSSIVADKARETYEAIKELRKVMPTKYKWQRNELENKIKELQNKWWKEIRIYMKKNGVYPPFKGKGDL